MEKPLGRTWVCLQVGWSKISGNYQVRVTRLMGSQIWCPPAGSVWGGLRRGTVASASPSGGKLLHPSSHSDARLFSSSSVLYNIPFYD